MLRAMGLLAAGGPPCTKAHLMTGTERSVRVQQKSYCVGQGWHPCSSMQMGHLTWTASAGKPSGSILNGFSAIRAPSWCLPLKMLQTALREGECPLLACLRHQSPLNISQLPD